MTAKPLPPAKVKRIHAGAYEVRVNGAVFTVDSDWSDPCDGREWRLYWFCRPGPYPGGAAFDRAETKRDAVNLCRLESNSEGM